MSAPNPVKAIANVVTGGLYGVGEAASNVASGKRNFVQGTVNAISGGLGPGSPVSGAAGKALTSAAVGALAPQQDAGTFRGTASSSSEPTFGSPATAPRQRRNFSTLLTSPSGIADDPATIQRKRLLGGPSAQLGF